MDNSERTHQPENLIPSVCEYLQAENASAALDIARLFDRLLLENAFPYLTSYEVALLIGVRGFQLGQNAERRVHIEPKFDHIGNEIFIAMQELLDGKLTDYEVNRRFPPTPSNLNDIMESYIKKQTAEDVTSASNDEQQEVTEHSRRRRLNRYDHNENLTVIKVSKLKLPRGLFK